MHTHAQGEVVRDQALLQWPRRQAAGGQNVQAGLNGPHRVVLVRALGAEGGLQAVAGEAQHPATLVEHAVGRTLQHATEQFERVLGVQLAGQRGGADDVGEEHRHLRPAPLGRCSGSGQQLAQRCQRQLGQDVTEQAALGLQHGDRPVQVLRDRCRRAAAAMDSSGWRIA